MTEGGGIFDEQPTVLSGDTVTLVHGTSFCVCRSDGEMDGTLAQGTFLQDTRIVSGWRLRVDGNPVEPLATMTSDPFHATFLGRVHPKDSSVESALLVHRERYVDIGMRDDELCLTRQLHGQSRGIRVKAHGVEYALDHLTFRAVVPRRESGPDV